MELAKRVAKLREMEAWEAKLEAEKTNADLGSVDRVCFGASNPDSASLLRRSSGGW
jgi:hypothetical protein